MASNWDGLILPSASTLRFGLFILVAVGMPIAGPKPTFSFLIAMRLGFSSNQRYAWDCAFEGAPSSTFLLEEREEKGLGDVLLANGLPRFESGVHGSDLSDDICSRPSS